VPGLHATGEATAVAILAEVIEAQPRSEQSTAR